MEWVWNMLKGDKKMKKVIIIISSTILAMILLFMAIIIYKNYLANDALFKAYLKKSKGEYTLVITSSKKMIFKDFWAVDNQEIKDGREKFMPWLKQEYTSKITKVIIEDPVSVKSTAYWFYDMSGLKEIEGLDKLETSNLEFTTSMFYNCKELTIVDLTSFKTENVISMAYMFYNNEKLGTIYVNEGNWSTKKVEYSNSMFENCYNLSGQNQTKYTEGITSVTFARVDKDEEPGYLTAR